MSYVGTKGAVLCGNLGSPSDRGCAIPGCGISLTQHRPRIPALDLPVCVVLCTSVARYANDKQYHPVTGQPVFLRMVIEDEDGRALKFRTRTKREYARVRPGMVAEAVLVRKKGRIKE